MQVQSKCSGTLCPSDTPPRGPTSGEDAGRYSFVAHGDAGRYIIVSRGDARRFAWFNRMLVCAIGVTIGIAPIVVSGGQLDHRLPQWSTLPSQPFVRQLPKGGQLLFAESHDAANAFYFLYVTDQIHAFSPARDKPLWSEPAQCRLLPRVLALSESRAVLSNRYEIFALDMRNGSRAWTFGQYPDDLGDVRFDHENAPGFRYFATAQDRILALRDNGELSAIDTQTGNAIATQPLPHQPVNQPVICDDRLVFAARTNKGERLCIVQFADDKIEHIADLNLGVTAAALTVTDNNLIVAASIAGVSAIDPIESRVRWRWRSNHPIVATSLRVAGDGIYIATQDKIIMKLWLASGVEAWRSQPLAMHRDGATRMEIIADHVIAIGDGFAGILDTASGKIIATPWKDEQVTANHCALTSQYMILLTQLNNGAEKGRSIRIHDHVSGKEVAAPKSMRSVGPLTESPTTIAMDDALIIHDGKRIYIWRVPLNPHRRLKSGR